MIKHIKRVGNGNAIFLDKALLDLMGIEVGGEVHVTVHQGSIVITPTNPRAVPEEIFVAALDRVVSSRQEVLRRLAK